VIAPTPGAVMNRRAMVLVLAVVDRSLDLQASGFMNTIAL
jgi:hypothetical protein